jgi:hypothetical protein
LNESAAKKTGHKRAFETKAVRNTEEIFAPFRLSSLLSLWFQIQRYARALITISHILDVASKEISDTDLSLSVIETDSFKNKEKDSRSRALCRAHLKETSMRNMRTWRERWRC